ncbi:hypothetical protein [Citromicrobium bathyomarinum]|uniref:hypothetical protein n=1 Tax=Citromicrobium bathyomarinum TaxID=72174 RepID=UPI001E493D42|nr:hypothetical protein [Citromicrobium bathyomarinum]MCD1624331.1 hypothetical protein [Citromicrobium bathyomarinum]
MAAPRIKTALSAFAGATLALTPLTAANSQQVEAQPVAYQVISDADSAANRWVERNPHMVAVSVSIGADTKVPQDVLERTLRSDFAANGVGSVQFFYESGGAGSSVVAYHSDEFVSDLYPLAIARNHVPEFARQFRYNRQFAANLTN